MKEEREMKEFLLKKMTEHWMQDNKGLMEDIQKLSSEIVFFNMKWGTRFNAKDILTNLTDESNDTKSTK